MFIIERLCVNIICGVMIDYNNKIKYNDILAICDTSGSWLIIHILNLYSLI